MSEKITNTKKRNWAFILYPESAPEDWFDLLQKTGLQGVVSPLHNNDFNATEEIKKSHYHIILSYAGPTSFNVVKGLCDSLNCPIPQALEQVRGYYRYLTHKDNPDKFQYDEKDIKTINGFNISDFVELSKSEVAQIKKSLQILIIENNFVEYSDFMDYLLNSDNNSNYDVAANNTYFFDRYISSKRHKQKNTKIIIDKETGEIL